MSDTHLEMIRRALDQSKWVVQAELPGDDKRISGYWEVARPNGDFKFKLAFEGLGDLNVLPIEKAYSCYVVNEENISLYFGRANKTFMQELYKFIKEINEKNT